MGDNRVIHKYSNLHEMWTLCGRYVSSHKGSMDIIASDKEHEVTCKACFRSLGEE